MWLAAYLVKFQIQDVLKLTVRELNIRTAEEFTTLDLQIRLKNLFRSPGKTTCIMARASKASKPRGGASRRLKLTVRELDIPRSAEELSTLDLAESTEVPIQRANAYINVLMTTDTLWISQLFKDMTTLPPPCSRQDYLHSGPCLQRFKTDRRYISKMRCHSSVGCTSTPGSTRISCGVHPVRAHVFRLHL